MPKLEVRGLTKRFGGIVALDDVSFDVEEGEILGLIGPNGAGKTTVFNCISRFYDPDGGRISFRGANLLRLPPAAIARAGVARTFQQAELFKSMTVLDNLLAGQHALIGGDRWGLLLPILGGGWAERELRRRALEIVDFLDLGKVRDAPASGLPFAVQKRVDLARALVSNPSLILMDEPASGLSHREMQALGQLILNIRHDLKVTVLLVEHHMDLVMGISDRVCVLDFGRKIAEGTPAAVQENPVVIEAYLGQRDAQA